MGEPQAEPKGRQREPKPVTCQSLFICICEVSLSPETFLQFVLTLDLLSLTYIPSLTESAILKALYSAIHVY